MRYQLEEPTIVEAIGYNEVCPNARFVFDTPIKVELDDVLELSNGCWYLITNGITIPLDGRWDR